MVDPEIQNLLINGAHAMQEGPSRRLVKPYATS